MNGGEIDLERKWYNRLIAGLPYTSTLSPLPIELVGKIFTVGSQKIVSSITLKLKDTVGGKVGTDLNKMEQMDNRKLSDPIGQQIDPTNDDIQTYTQDKWDDIKRIYVQQDLPLPLEILSMSMGVETGGR